MNKQEAIEELKMFYYLDEDSRKVVELYDAIQIINKISEPEKQVIPQFVADWIEECKKKGQNLYRAMDVELVEEDSPLDDWFFNNDNDEHYDTFARAWLDGYEIEKEKLYTVRINHVYGQYLGRYYIDIDEELLVPKFVANRVNQENDAFTKSELEESGFGWVFNCKGVEVREVKE